MSNNLFKEFDAVSEKQWKQKIQMDLKGADYNETLITATREGINIKPFYHSDTAPDLPLTKRATHYGGWYISQTIYCDDAVKANKKALDALNRGAEGVRLFIPNNTIDLAILLKNLNAPGIQVHPQFLDLDFINKLHSINDKLYIHLDSIYQLGATGNWFENKNADFTQLIKFVENYSGYFSNITVNTSHYVNAGATVVQELAYYLSHLNEYLNLLDKEDKLALFDSDNKTPKRINVDVAVGSNYFMETAKSKAYRLLTAALGKQYGLSNLGCYITACPSSRNKSALDFNNNMLRTTTECMSAICGGADTITNLRYDSVFQDTSEFSERIARNQLRILKDEAYLDKIHNPTDGAYFIESLTQELVNKATDLFIQIESSGGFITSLYDGTIQRKIKEAAQIEQNQIATSERILVGVNKYKPDNAQVDKTVVALKRVERKTAIEPIVAKRLALTTELDS